KVSKTQVKSSDFSNKIVILKWLEVKIREGELFRLRLFLKDEKVEARVVGVVGGIKQCQYI
ncbi:hypothetical protein H5410_028704, partial [Solanum commersonii]